VTTEYWEAAAHAFEDDEHTCYTEAHCEQLRSEALENFDLNMAFFDRIVPEAFEAAIASMLSTTKQLRPITSLDSLDGAEGLYVMVLDEYRQAYVGKSIDMRRRIKSHWAGSKPLDRLTFGDPRTSVLSIDVFRPLDTTRIYAAKTTRADQLERRLEREIPADYLLNRIWGGDMTPARALLISAEMKRRQLLGAEPA